MSDIVREYEKASDVYVAFMKTMNGIAQAEVLYPEIQIPREVYTYADEINTIFEDVKRRFREETGREPPPPDFSKLGSRTLGFAVSGAALVAIILGSLAVGGVVTYLSVGRMKKRLEDIIVAVAKAIKDLPKETQDKILALLGSSRAATEREEFYKTVKWVGIAGVISYFVFGFGKKK